MASFIYDKARKSFADGEIPLLTGDIKILLVSIEDGAGYTANQATDQFLSIIPNDACRVATSGNLANKTTTAGVFDADDVLFTAVTGDPDAAVLYHDVGGADGSRRLIAYLDTPDFSVTGIDVTLVFDAGSNRIFKL